jgi:hypothetical protein
VLAWGFIRSGVHCENFRAPAVRSRKGGYAEPSWDIESPRFDRSALTGRSLKEIENSRPKKCLVSGAPMFVLASLYS